MYVLHVYVVANWASKASPTLGCSIEISRDIYIYVCLSMGNPYKKDVCQKCMGETRMLKVSLGW